METGGRRGGTFQYNQLIRNSFLKGVVRQEKRGVEKCIDGTVSTSYTIAAVSQVNLKGPSLLQSQKIVSQRKGGVCFETAWAIKKVFPLLMIPFDVDTMGTEAYIHTRPVPFNTDRRQFCVHL
jgi:hypothetical protein